MKKIYAMILAGAITLTSMGGSFALALDPAPNPVETVKNTISILNTTVEVKEESLKQFDLATMEKDEIILVNNTSHPSPEMVEFNVSPELSVEYFAGPAFKVDISERTKEITFSRPITEVYVRFSNETSSEVINVKYINNTKQINTPPVFLDVPTWASKYVNSTKNLGITNGKGPGELGGNLNATRQEAAAFIVRSMNVDENLFDTVELPFADNNKIDKYAVNYIKASYAMGLFTGTKDNASSKVYSNAKNSITRAEFFALVSRMYRLKNTIDNKKVSEFDLTTFKDSKDLETNRFSWFKEDARLLGAYKIVTGDNGNFNFAKNITRNEILTAIARIVDKNVEGKPNEDPYKTTNEYPELSKIFNISATSEQTDKNGIISENYILKGLNYSKDYIVATYKVALAKCGYKYYKTNNENPVYSKGTYTVEIATKDGLKIIIDPNGAMTNIPSYKDFKDVPDFGKMYPNAEILIGESDKDGAMYMYDTISLKGDYFKAYHDLLISNGYELEDEQKDSEDGVNTISRGYSKGKQIVSISKIEDSQLNEENFMIMIFPDILF